MYDLISLQGLIAHLRGEWFSRLAVELRAGAQRPDLARSLFDSHLCVGEYLLYGPTPYARSAGARRHTARVGPAGRRAAGGRLRHRPAR